MTSAPSQKAPSLKRTSKMASNLNLNHLLNFTLPPRQTQPLPRRSKKTWTQEGVWSKERFVNAQYRFMMNPMGDYTVHFADPDIFFQWQDILQVIIPRSSASAASLGGGERDEGETTCPICLSPPKAPRMTKCGHVYCFPCILHYLNTTDLKWARCPICFDSVNERQLKSVKWYDGPIHSHVDPQAPEVEPSSSSSLVESTSGGALRLGSTLKMRLMQRPQITTLALPRSHTWPSDLIPPHQAPFHFLPDVYNYSKFMLGTPAYLIADLARDLDELATERRTLAGMADDLGISFVDAADKKICDQIAKATALETNVLKDNIDKARRDQSEIEDRFAFYDHRKKEEESAHALCSETHNALVEMDAAGFALSASGPSPAFNHAVPIPNRGAHRQRRNLNPPPPSTSTYFFYQAASGLPLFLHPLDIKILLSHFNGYVSFPNTISIRVEAFVEGSVNDDLRKRCKYLSHLPEGADVIFVEADLKGVVGADGLKNFEGALKMRRARRKEKNKKDDRARARAEEREREKEKDVVSMSDIVHRPSSFSVRDSPVRESTPLPESPTRLAGAWGTRSFASALNSAPAQRREAGQLAVRREEEDDDDWDIDEAWHELEQRSSEGRKKRSNKLIVLGGGGRRR